MDKKKPSGKFVFIDDDPDEHELVQLAINSLGLSEQLKSFTSAEAALTYLGETKDEIFVIISDLNMPRMDGLALKRYLENIPELKMKAIPFFFHSNTGTAAEIRTAYTQNIQGFLRKSSDLNGTINSLKNIIALWTDCVHPKDFGRTIH